MTTLAVLIGLMMGAIIFGKRSKRITPMTYLILALLALLQVGFLLFRMFTMQRPEL
jgi:hypothetical protein